MPKRSPQSPVHLILLRQPDAAIFEGVRKDLLAAGLRPVVQLRPGAFQVRCDARRLEEFRRDERLAGVFSRPISEAARKELRGAAAEAARLWNFARSREYREGARMTPEAAASTWASEKGKDGCLHYGMYDPDALMLQLDRALGITEEQKERWRKEYEGRERPPKEETRRRLEEAYRGDTGVGFELRGILEFLPWFYTEEIILTQPGKVSQALHGGCRRMMGRIAVGIIIIESSRSDGPRFTDADRDTIINKIIDGLDWLGSYEPKAQLEWSFDLHRIEIDVEESSYESESCEKAGGGVKFTGKEEFWRDPALQKLEFEGQTFGDGFGAIDDYRDALKAATGADHAVVYLVTPYDNCWFAYAGSSRIVMADKNGWGGWGIGQMHLTAAHEMCHLFGAKDEYTGSGSPCPDCGGGFGCFHTPNGNCAACAKPHQVCVMNGKNYRICGYTQGQIGWADLLVEVETGTEWWSGTDDNVWLDIGEEEFELDIPDFNDRENGQIEAYAFNFTGLEASDIERIGLRKSPDGWYGDWLPKHIRVWVKDQIICDTDVGEWLKEDRLWWFDEDSVASGSDLVNELQVRVTTANEAFAGTDDDVYIRIGSREWKLDRPTHDDFEQGNTDVFHLDPGIGLRLDDLTSVMIRKPTDAWGLGPWKLEGLKIRANGNTIYNNQDINVWIQTGNLTWSAQI